MAGNWQSTIAFYLSIATAGFSGFQWWNTEKESRINAAMDISRKLFEDNKEIDDIGMMRLFGDPSETKRVITDEENRRVLRIMLQLEYIAKLMNENKVDSNYIAPSLKCFIAAADLASEKAEQRGMSLPTPEAHKIRSALDLKLCSSF